MPLDGSVRSNYQGIAAIIQASTAALMPQLISGDHPCAAFGRPSCNLTRFSFFMVTHPLCGPYKLPGQFLRNSNYTHDVASLF